MLCRKDDAKQTDARCSGKQDLFEKLYCTVTTAAEKADKMEINQIPETPAKKPRKVENENYEQ